jgi:hypothetical protein
MGKKIRTVLLVFCIVGGTGCAQTMVGCSPSPLDRSVLEVGAHRSDVVAALGSGRGRFKEGSVTRTENYDYIDGGAKNSVPSKIGRILLYTAGDVFTLFISQILFMPIETVAFAGTQYRTNVDYQLYTDGTWRVRDFAEGSRGKYRPADGGLCN